MSVVLGSSAECAIDLVSDDEVQPPMRSLSHGAEQSVPGRTYVTRASARKAQMARDIGTQGRAPATTEPRVVFDSKAQSMRALAATTTTLSSRILDHSARQGGRNGEAYTPNTDQGTSLGNTPAVHVNNTGSTYPAIGHTHAELSGAAIATTRPTPYPSVEKTTLSSDVQHQHFHSQSTAWTGQQNSANYTFGIPNMPGNLSLGRSNERNGNFSQDRSAVAPPTWGSSYANTNIGFSTHAPLPYGGPTSELGRNQIEVNAETAVSEALHERRTTLLAMRERPALRSRTVQDRYRGPDIVELKSHKHLETWKKKLAQEFHIEEEMKQLSAAVLLFDRRDIQTVVPNRYLKETSRSSEKNRPRYAKFPGTVEVLTEQPMRALRKAYSEHTAVVPDPSRLVFWTDGSAGGDHRRPKSRGFAVTWRRATDEGTWGGWEAAGFQVQGEMLNAGGMETLAVMKAVVKALELVRQTPGRIKAVAIYTDSASTLTSVRNPRLPLIRLIIEKARMLTQLGPTVSLHWCPGHSKIPGNELADQIAGMARSHVYGNSREVVDLSDDEDD